MARRLAALGRRVRDEGPAAAIRILRSKWSHHQIEKQHDQDYHRYFGILGRQLNPGIPLLRTEDINSPEVRDRLKKIRPSLLVDHGTSIVKPHILRTARLALNVHWGLSPYYRGTHCTEWAVLNGDLHNIGVTIHRLADTVDGGDIVAQERAFVRLTDTAHSIDMQLTRKGSKIMSKAIDAMQKGRTLHFVKQDLTRGRLYLNREWTPRHEDRVRALERNGGIGRMLRIPMTGRKLPIVSFRSLPR
ncbi:MAG: hypothetical protein HYT87_10040 [Nitrospirae bacterium]|nr:hypothetical protein [Nitrospirota bacterium]